MRITKDLKGITPALSELKTSILRAKVYFLARVFGWRFVEQMDLSLVSEEPPVSIIDLGLKKALCPLTGTAYRGDKAVIRYRRLHVTISWTWWLAFRLKHVIGVHVHPDIPVHIVPGAHYRSIMIGWLEEPEYIGHDS